MFVGFNHLLKLKESVIITFVIVDILCIISSLLPLQIMAKLLPDQKGSLLQSDVVDLICDKVVSLCQRKYNGVNLLEIDGLICISLQDTNEQQIVKIHKTLPTTISTKSACTQTQISQLKDNVTDSVNQVSSEGFSTNYQHDISILSELLKTTARQKDKLPSICEEEDRKSKRKRKHPQQRSLVNRDVLFDDNIIKKFKESEQEVREQVNLPSTNPFLHKEHLAKFPLDRNKDVINRTSPSPKTEAENVPVEIPVVVKEEPLDPDYYNTQPKIVNVQSIADEQYDKDDTGESNTADVDCEKAVDAKKTAAGKAEKVSSIIDRLIEKDFQKQTEKKDMPDSNNGSCDSNDVGNTYNDVVTVKTEVVDKEYEYVGASSNCDTADESDTAVKESENPCVRNSEEFAALIGLHKANDETKNEPLLTSSRFHWEPRPSSPVKEKSWIDMVKDNVSKYQAALIRSGKTKPPMNTPKLLLKETKVNVSDKVAMVHPMGASGAVSSVTSKPSSLLSLLQTPAALQNKTEALIARDQELRERLSSRHYGGTESHNQKSERSLSVPKTTGCVNSNSDRSSSCSPVVKIEVDEVDHGALAELISQNNTEKQGGKLESLYPALFNQLQEPPKGNSGQSFEGDSLVNRLPFISFQEIFSSAATGGAIPKLSESKTKELLEKARINPHPNRGKHKSKTVWNWKKRFVKGGRDGSQESSAQSLDVDKPLGINMSASKTFARRDSKEKSDSDNEWKPAGDEVEDVIDIAKTESERGEDGGNRGLRRRTRLSRGKTARINFAEMENSDFEMEEQAYDDDINNPPLELVSAFCGYNCGKKFESIVELELHEEQCQLGRGSPLAAGFSEQFNSGAGSSTSNKDNYSCEICGLEFNQEYRRIYHMIKVHGLSTEELNINQSVFR